MRNTTLSPHFVAHTECASWRRWYSTNRYNIWGEGGGGGGIQERLKKLESPLPMYFGNYNGIAVDIEDSCWFPCPQTAWGPIRGRFIQERLERLESPLPVYFGNYNGITVDIEDSCWLPCPQAAWGPIHGRFIPKLHSRYSLWLELGLRLY